MTTVLAYILTTPDGTKMRSYHRHDFQTYLDKNGKLYMVDGGNDYLRRSANGDEVIDTVTTDDPFEKQREFFCWGTRGKDGMQPLKWVPLKDLESDHILAIIETQAQITAEIRGLFEQELLYRTKE